MTDNLQCNICGMKFRSLAAEAKHRHNFPAFCNRLSPGWKAYQAAQALGNELGRVLREPPVPPATFREACERIFDIMLGNDGEAFFQAERFLKANAPDLYERLGK